MKTLLPAFALMMALLSCNNNGNKEITPPEEKQSFFPVTSFIKGEIYNIKKNGINPVRHTTVGDKTDSVWLKIEELDSAVQEFLHPEIDSANLVSLFTEKSFLDQTINAVTLTYEAKATLPDSMDLTNWDVYIDPKLNTVRRVYMVKQVSPSTVLQLTWVSNKWCKITTIITDAAGVSKVEKEEKITWDF